MNSFPSFHPSLNRKNVGASVLITITLIILKVKGLNNWPHEGYTFIFYIHNMSTLNLQNRKYPSMNPLRCLLLQSLY